MPVSDVVKIFKGFQEMVYSFAEMKASLSRTKRGPRSKELKEICELLISQVEKGSIVFHVTTREPKKTLFGVDRFGIDVLTKSQQMLGWISESNVEKIKELAPDKGYRDKIVRKAQNFLPKKNSETTMIIKGPEIGEIEVSQLEKEILNQVVIPLSRPENQISTKLADIKGIAFFDSEDIFQGFDTVLEIEELPGIALNSVQGKHYTYVFSNRLYFDVKDVDDIKLITQSDLDIITYCESHEDIGEVLGKEFDILWLEYVEAEDETLDKSAAELKKRVLDIVTTRTIS